MAQYIGVSTPPFPSSIYGCSKTLFPNKYGCPISQYGCPFSPFSPANIWVSQNYASQNSFKHLPFMGVQKLHFQKLRPKTLSMGEIYGCPEIFS